MSTRYTALTIGPIYDTMRLTSTPAGLWGASGLFSWIARELIDRLIRQGVPAERFISPWFQLRDGQIVLSEGEEDCVCEEMRARGVGLFHDRLLFEGDWREEARAAVTQVNETLAAKLWDSLQKASQTWDEEAIRAWLRGALRIGVLAMDVPDGAAPADYLGRYLSALELEPNFVIRERENPLLALFENTFAAVQPEAEGRNERLKESFLRPKGDWILRKGRDNIRNLADVANPGGEKLRWKSQQYYAVLKSDGDSMGEILSALTGREEIRAYSRKCLLFCAQAAKVIADYGGMPIYAGGDDLLALAPVVGYDPKTKEPCSVFRLAELLRGIFNQHFSTERVLYYGKPAISFGIAVQYVKSPLYEALERADEMLGRAKSGAKNACYLNLQKRSRFMVDIYETLLDEREKTRGNTLLSVLDEMLMQVRREDIEFLSSVGSQFEVFRPLFLVALKQEREGSTGLANLFDNLFDSVGQRKFEDYLQKLKDCTLRIVEEGAPEEAETTMDRLQALVRLLHFMQETGAEEEEVGE